MILDLEKYKVNRPFIKRYFKEKGGDPVYAICLIAATIQCPIIALSFYLAEDIGFTPEIIKTIQGQIDRGYVVVNQPENSPFLTTK